MSFANKVVIVTGASSGIGATAAIAFAKEGANVVIVARNEVKLQEVADECAASGKEHLLIKADITKDEDARKVINDTIEKFGQIDVVVNNAGMMGFAKIVSENIMSVYDTVMNLNVRAQLHMTHLAAPHLIKTKGNIINVSSIAGKMSFTDPMLCYAISKAAVDHFTRNVALELAPLGVRVNTISPGPVRTDILSNAGVQMSLEDINYKIPLGRISETDEIADLMLFLASDKAKAITGSDFVTDNGILLR
ncbi:3-oxoacyl-[acyl-carrier-protein] reductase FabG-like [Vanessa cardui]|uniref:3-oxoacyl-[acyl-carrier-protein] reductase FabG-like n=1 Tax=Vanessa cardui TaxID=171605 RepID=UPI001F131BCF|nr:3-oxoacyl-[acyl-carrier-protein] reductase FabG-like [Vanessa cardui]